MENSMTIKRGMVFYLDEPYKDQPIEIDSANMDNYPKKKRPYIVVSNDKCNESSNLIHVAPIFSITNTLIPKWWKIPFKGPCNRDSYVNVSYIMLVSSTILNETSYSQAITQYTIHNKNLFNGIDKAICKQFGVGSDVINTAVYDTMDKYPVNNQPVVPNITLNISVNGIPVDCSNVTVSTQNELEPKDSAEIIRNKKESEYNISKVETDSVQKPKKYTAKKFNLKAGDKFTKEEKNFIEEYILSNGKKFKGRKTGIQLAKSLGISYSTVCRVIKKLSKTYEGRTRFTIPQEVIPELIDDYYKHGSRYCVEKYRQYGLKTTKQVQQKVNHEKLKMKMAQK